MFHIKIHRIFFYISLFLIPIQTRILYNPDKAYISWYFNYHLAFFLYLSDITLFLCFTCWLLFDPPNLRKLINNRLFLLFTAFLAITLVSLFHVKRLDLGIYQSIKWTEFFLLLLYIYWTIKEEAEIVIISIILFMSAILQGILAWLQFHMQHMIGLNLLGEYIAPFGTSGLATIDSSSSKIIRAYGTFSHPNVLGAFLVLGLVCGLILVSYETRPHKINHMTRVMVLIGIFLIAIGLFTTFSRLAWLAAAIGAVSIIGYYIWKKEKIFALLILIPLIVSCATVLALYRTDLKARVSDSNSSSVDDRLFFNQLGTDLVKHYPILGVGVGNYVIGLEHFYALQPWQYQPSHNIFIFISAELGLLGVLLFIAILFVIFSKIKDTEGGLLTFSLTLVGILFLLMSLFDHYFVTIQQGRLMFATVLGLIAALPNLNTHEKTN